MQKEGRQNCHAQSVALLVGRRFAHQRFADSRESTRRKIPIFEALGQIRANRVFSPIRIEILVIRVQSSLLSHLKKIFGRSIHEKEVFSKRESIRANRPTKARATEGCEAIFDTQ